MTTHNFKTLVKLKNVQGKMEALKSTFEVGSAIL
jgi:hypothetical protein